MQAQPTLTPRMTSWGQLNAKQSFNILTQDLDRAIAFARLSPTETPFLEQVREACWAEAIRLGKRREGAWPEALGCRINLTALAESTGISRQQWSVAKRGLIAAKILVEDDDGILQINKRADEWIFPKSKKSRLTAKLIEFCRSVQPNDPGAAQARFGFTQERVNPRSRHQTIVATGLADFVAPRRDPDGSRADGLTVPMVPPDGGRADGPTVAASQPRHPAAVPIEERPRGVLEGAEERREGVEAKPPAPDSNFVSGRPQPWTASQAERDYRALADARPEPVAHRPGAPGRTVSREGPPAVRVEPTGMIARMMARNPGFLSGIGGRP